MAGGSGAYDAPVGYTAGNQDQQVGFAFEKQLYMEARTRTIIGALSKDGAAGGAVTDSYAGAGPSLDGSAVIERKQITEGGYVTLSMQEHVTGMPTYGDSQHPMGDPLAYKNLRAFVNMINSPAIPVPGEMAQQRVKMSITNMPSSIKEEVIDYMAEQMEIEFLYSLLYGASPSILKAGADCNLSLGINAGAGVGVPLMPRWWFDGFNGFSTYSLTPSTWNSTVNNAVNTLATQSTGIVALSDFQMIRNKLDTEKFWPIKFDGQKYKALALCDTEIWHRIHNLLGDSYKYAMPRGLDNPLFGVDYVLKYDGFMFIPVPNLNKLRPKYNASNGFPDFGPSMTTDHRSYTNSETKGMIIFVTSKAVVEGYNGSIAVKTNTGKFEKGMDIAGRTQLGYVRGEWYAKDGRSTSTDLTLVRNYSSLVALFYEPGVGVSYS